MDPLSHAVTTCDSAVLDMVRDALNLNRCVLAYQPIVQSGDFKKGAFYEGLIRIVDPSGRYIPAKGFMGSVEDLELGRQVDCASLDLGLKALEVYLHLHLSINRSARSIGYLQWF